MKPITREWIEKGEKDFLSAQREYRARKQPNFDAACFFAQQCVEKYLKARLRQGEIDFPRTHDLSALLDLVVGIEPSWAAFRPMIETLTSYAVEFRYPGESATREMARTAISDAKAIRAAIREDMGLGISKA
jgi:HEPN domain-containing protein